MRAYASQRAHLAAHRRRRPRAVQPTCTCTCVVPMSTAHSCTGGPAAGCRMCRERPRRPVLPLPLAAAPAVALRPWHAIVGPTPTPHTPTRPTAGQRQVQDRLPPARGGLHLPHMPHAQVCGPAAYPPACLLPAEHGQPADSRPQQAGAAAGGPPISHAGICGAVARQATHGTGDLSCCLAHSRAAKPRALKPPCSLLTAVWPTCTTW